MAWLLVFFAGCTVGSLVTTAVLAIMAAGKLGDRQIDPQRQWFDDVRRLLKEAQ